MKAKKSLGQHFLTSKKVVKEMIAASSVSAKDTVLEVGPGKGILTEALLAHGVRVVAIEKDERMVSILEEKFSREIQDKRLKLIHGDILNQALWQGVVRTQKLHDGKYSVIANIPYYITGLLFRRFLEEGPQPRMLTFLVQKEVARNAVGFGGKESILSLSLKAYGDPRIVRKVDKKVFSPMPKVDSAILTIANIGRDRLSTKEEGRFFALIHAGFSSKRKTLANNLAHGLAMEKIQALRLLSSHGIEGNARAEDVPLLRWLSLTRALAN